MAMSNFPLLVVKKEDPKDEEMYLDQTKSLTNYNETSNDAKEINNIFYPEIKMNINQSENYNNFIQNIKQEEEDDSQQNESFGRLEVLPPSNIKLENNHDLDASFLNARVKIENDDPNEQSSSLKEELGSYLKTCTYNDRKEYNTSQPRSYNIVNRKVGELINSENSDSIEKKIWKSGEKEAFVANAKKIQLADKPSLYSLSVPDLRSICHRFGWIVTGDRIKIVTRILRKCRAIIAKPAAPKCRRSFGGPKYKYISKTSSDEASQQNPSTSVECNPDFKNEDIGSESFEDVGESEDSYIKTQWTTNDERKMFVESCGKSDLLELWSSRSPLLWSLRMTDLKDICKRFGWGTNGIKEKLINRIARRCNQDSATPDQDDSNPAYFVEPGISTASSELDENAQIDDNEEETGSKNQTENCVSESQEDPLCMVYSAEHVVKNGKLTVGRSLFPC